MTAVTFWSTSPCATFFASSLSALSSTATISICTGLPATLKPAALRSAAASLAPLTMSCPRAADGPDRGCATPIVIVAGMRGPQAESSQATHTAVRMLESSERGSVMWLSRNRSEPNYAPEEGAAGPI